MKTLLERISVTKLVLLLIVLALIAIELYNVFTGKDVDQLFTDVTLMVISYYFAQKGIKYDKPDSVIEDLESNKEEKWA